MNVPLQRPALPLPSVFVTRPGQLYALAANALVLNPRAANALLASAELARAQRSMAAHVKASLSIIVLN